MNIQQFIKNIIHMFYTKQYDRRLSDINPNTIIPESTIFAHRGIGVVIGSRVELGNHVFIGQNVTLGGRHGGQPTIEDDVMIHAYSIIIGNITVGRCSIIGAGTMVLADVPPYSIIRGGVWKI